MHASSVFFQASDLVFILMQILDLMGYSPSHENKINIHVGGTYGDKEATIKRFAANFCRLSPACQKRLTVENDDIPNSYSLADLMPLHKLTGIPLVGASLWILCLRHMGFFSLAMKWRICS